MLISNSPINSTNAYDAFARDSPARPNNSSHAIEPLGGFAGYFRTRGQHAADCIQAGTPLVFIRRQQFWDGGEARLRLEQQHEELLAHDLLELRKRKTRTCVVRANPPQCLQAALVDHSRAELPT